MIALITAALGALTGIIVILNYFIIKTPEQKEQQDLDRIKKNEDELAKSITKVQSGDPADLSKLLNGK